MGDLKELTDALDELLRRRALVTKALVLAWPNVKQYDDAFDDGYATFVARLREITQARHELEATVWRCREALTTIDAMGATGRDTPSDRQLGAKHAAKVLRAALLGDTSTPPSCKACDARRDRGFDGLCPSCANERARKER